MMRSAIPVSTTIADARARLGAWRQAGEHIALVPTMGNLHAGHLHLVEQARRRAERVVVSIFVNPLQFGQGEDFDSYPRTLEQDLERLAPLGTDLVFTPGEREMYPHGREGATTVEVPGLSELLCGASRPGHFRGVATVVAKLFNIVQPDLALFGEKDYQQLLVIRRMAADLNLPLKIVGVPTVRESDGLAMSSRNAYLSPQERQHAPCLYHALQRVGEALNAGRRDYAALETEAAGELCEAGMRPDYVSIRRADDLAPPGAGDSRLAILAAAHLGKARLIDNLLIEL